MGDTSLVFNLIAKDKVGQGLKKAGDTVKKTSAAIGAAGAAALGVGLLGALDMGAANAKMAGQLGLNGPMAAKMGAMAGSIYADNFGGSMEEVDSALVVVKQSLGGLGKQGVDTLQGMTENALTFSSTFDQDVGGTTNAVAQMLRTGLASSAEEAFDILTKGMQNGANKADDLLDTFNEYGTQFRKLGISGSDAMGLISQGLKGGARDADVVADAIKEFSIRSVDGSATTAAGFKAIGWNAKDAARQIGKGGEAAENAFHSTLMGLKQIKDPAKRAQTAVMLFGTQAEDLGDALYSLDLNKVSKEMDGVSGSTKRMTDAVGNNPAAQLETFKRKAMQSLTEVGGQLVTFGMAHQRYVQPLIVGIAALAGTVLVVRGAMMAWSAAMGIWKAAQVAATVVQWAFNAAMWASPITWIVAAIIALVVVIVLMVRHWDLVKRVAVNTWSAIWGALKRFGSMLPGFGRMLLNFFLGPFRGIWAGWVWLNNRLDAGISSVGHAFSRFAGYITAPFRDGLNAAIGMWNRTIGGFGFSVPDYVPGFGGTSFSFPSIPYLAKGGIIDRPTLAMIGEAGPEAVVPLDQYRPGGGAAAARSEQRVIVELNVRGADESLLRWLRKMLRPRGGSTALEVS